MHELVIADSLASLVCLIPVFHFLDESIELRNDSRFFAHFANSSDLGSLTLVHKTFRKLPPRRTSDGYQCRFKTSRGLPHCHSASGDLSLGSYRFTCGCHEPGQPCRRSLPL